MRKNQLETIVLAGFKENELEEDKENVQGL